jgi:acyl-CoA synthetase (AMP-forming)/AMP-acid ligase II/acyl carrier protein
VRSALPDSLISRIRPRFRRDLFSFVRAAMTTPPPTPDPVVASVSALLVRRAEQRPDQPAFVFLPDPAGHGTVSDVAWTYADLDRRARAVARAISELADPGDRAVLVFPPGLDFLAAFFGCLYAGVLPVPATYPKPRRPSSRLDAIAADCTPRLALTTAETLATLKLDEQSPAVRDLPWLAVDQCDASGMLPGPVDRRSDDPAFLQYTSGSTLQPRGVVVTHGNLLHNLELIRTGFGIAAAERGEVVKGVFWLPAYHDMGLIGGLLTPLYVGGTSYLLAPAAFLQRPIAWLETISRTGATVSGAPNFAYDLCARKIAPDDAAKLDLRNWRLAFCGAEPIDPSALRNFAAAFATVGFRTETFYPCYGLAEATLLVTGGAGPGALHTLHADRDRLAANELTAASPSSTSSQELVSCGRPLGDQDVRVVDPKTFQPLPTGAIGEVWVRGRSVAAGYWNHPEELLQTFGGRLADGYGPFLRTGDLGAFHDGELYVTGRLKDVVIIRGRNLYPQDIERVAHQAHPAVELGAAFAVDRNGAEQLVVVHQVSREHRRGDLAPVIRAIRSSIVEEHEVDPHAIVLLRPGALPLTSSGKVQRSRCREMFLSGELDSLAEWSQPDEPRAAAGAETAHCDPAAATGSPPRPKFLDHVATYTPEALAIEVQHWMLAWLADRVGVAAGELSATAPFTELGMDSLTAIELNVEFERVLGLRLPPVAAWSYPTPAALSRYLAETMLGVVPAPGAEGGDLLDSWFQAMDADVQR